MTKQTHEKMERFPIAEILKGIPGLVGIQLDEEPEYEVIRKIGEIEIRKYAATTQASTEVVGDEFKDATGQAFVKLANYIFIKNDRSEQMPMTSPVLVKETSSGWKMSFFLPKKFSGSTVNKPLDPQVKVEQIAEKIYAVLSFTGNMSESVLHEKTQELTRGLAHSDSVKIKGKPITAQYDQPFSVPFFKKNEAWIEVEI